MSVVSSILDSSAPIYPCLARLSRRRSTTLGRSHHLFPVGTSHASVVLSRRPSTRDTPPLHLLKMACLVFSFRNGRTKHSSASCDLLLPSTSKPNSFSSQSLTHNQKSYTAPSSNLFLTPSSTTMQRTNKNNLIPFPKHTIPLALQLPISIIHKHQDPRPHITVVHDEEVFFG